MRPLGQGLCLLQLSQRLCRLRSLYQDGAQQWATLLTTALCKTQLRAKNTMLLLATVHNPMQDDNVLTSQQVPSA